MAARITRTLYGYGQTMKISLRMLLLLVAAFAVIFSIAKWQLDRQKRVQLAYAKLTAARDPVSTSNAFRYLRSIGIHETTLALKQLHSKGDRDDFMRHKVPFLFEPAQGIPPRSKFVAYSNGLIFTCFPRGTRLIEHCPDFTDAKLKFSSFSFVPNDDLGFVCDQAIQQFDSQRSDEWPHIPDDVESSLRYQLTGALEHLRPERKEIVVEPEFLKRNDLIWNVENERYELR